MSITKGAMLISNANAVGAELVNKLGGTGYKPVEWADAINLLGISNDDKASALASITEGTYAGDERGSIKYSNCNAVGSMLNKKFSTDRGFKPVEWESAISKLTPLAERTVSGSIVTFSDGADDVPTKSLIVTIPPTLTGVLEVSATQTGRNLFNLDRTEGTPDPTDIIISPRILDVTKLFKGLRADNYFYAGYASYSISGGVLSVTTSNNLNYGIAFPVRVKGGATYCLSAILTGTNMSVGCYDKDWNFISRIFGMVSDASRSFATPSNAEYISVVFGSSTLNVEGTVSNIQLEFGSTAHDYEPYQTPTVYTASLGRTIYGGNVDVVKGEGQETYQTIQVGELTFAKVATHTFRCNNFDRVFGNGKYNIYSYQFATYTQGHSTDSNIASLEQGNDNTIFTNAGSGTFYISTDSNFDDKTVEDFITAYGNAILIYETTTPTDFTFEPVEINSRIGNNTMWSDEGDTEVTYRKDPDIPDPPVQLLNTDNNENNDN